MRIVLSALLAFLLLAALPGSASCEAPYTLRTAWLVEHEAFAAWYARQNGWDVEAGFRLGYAILRDGPGAHGRHAASPLGDRRFAARCPL